jgi:hypothetical protein
MNASRCYAVRTVRVLYSLRTANNLSVLKLTCPKEDICTLSCRRFTSFVVNCRFKDVSNKPWLDGETEGLVLAVGHSSLNPASPVDTQHSTAMALKIESNKGKEARDLRPSPASPFCVSFSCLACNEGTCITEGTLRNTKPSK